MSTILKMEIPNEVLNALKLPPQEIEKQLRRELALALYQRGVLSLGKARIFAQMTRWEFEEFLGERQVIRHYNERDLEEDISYGSGHQ